MALKVFLLPLHSCLQVQDRAGRMVTLGSEQLGSSMKLLNFEQVTSLL